MNLNPYDAERLDCTLLVAHAALGRLRQECINAARAAKLGSREKYALLNRASQLIAHQDTCIEFMDRIQASLAPRVGVEAPAAPGYH